MTATIDEFGETPEGVAGLVTLKNASGLEVAATNWGARLTRIALPDRNGVQADILLGYDSAEEYVAADPYFGAVCGRVANRIAAGAFTLDGVARQASRNEGGHCLHGGERGFDKRLWSLRFDASSVTFERVSPDGEEGFPGALATSARYALTEDDALEIEMRAETDAPTLVNLANHAYWNLAGHGAGSILEHRLAIDADFYTPNGPDLTPTGEVLSVAGLAVDFRAEKPIGRDMGAYVDPERGYDCNFAVRGAPGALRRVARLYEPGSGRGFELFSDQPGVQLYVGGSLSDETFIGKGGARYDRHSGLCLETQGFPNAANVPQFPPQRLDPGMVYRHRMVFRFFAE